MAVRLRSLAGHGMSLPVPLADVKGLKWNTQQ